MLCQMLMALKWKVKEADLVLAESDQREKPVAHSECDEKWFNLSDLL